MNINPAVTRAIPTILVLLCIQFPFTVSASGSGASEKTDIEERTAELMDVTEQLRGLSFLRDLPVELLSEEEIREVINEQLDMEIDPEKDRIYSSLYTMLGLMPRDSSIRDEYQSLAEEQVAGLYDPRGKRFYVVDVDLGSVLEGMFGDLGALGGFIEGFLSGLDFDMSDVIIVHELTHAVDDQHFDIEGRMDQLLESNSDDAQLAYQSLVEGDATRVMNEYTYGRLGLDESTVAGLSEMSMSMAEDMMSYSPFLERLMIVPYFKGEELVNYILDREGQAGLDRAFNDPPESMEQVLHPERYAPNRDEPSYVAPPDLSGVLSGWNLEATDTMGELIIGLMFEMYVTDKEGGERIGDGWDYDVATTWRSPGNDLALVWLSVWDIEPDAQEFFDAYCDLLEAKYPSGDWRERGTEYGLYAGMGLAAAVELCGGMVAIVEGVPEEKADASLAAAWSARVTYR